MSDQPTQIGRFEIKMELGRGAMGCVYLAHDPKIERKVAIKTIKANPGTSQAEASESRIRFLREAQAAGKLLHPGIVTIFDVGEEDGESYIAMEYIDGPTLEAATKPDNLLPVEKAVDLTAQAARALHFAHQNKIIHRDVKPANLMLLDDKVVKVTDFGLAKNPSANLTSAGTLIGTPTYMSPEQIMGKDLDGRSDLFSLGVVLYELLTGDRPFGGETISTIIYKILHELPKRPDLVNPRVPAPLCKALMQALDKDPAKRYASCDEFARSLDGFISSTTSGTGRAAPPTELLGPGVAPAAGGSMLGPELELADPGYHAESMAEVARSSAERSLASQSSLRSTEAAAVAAAGAAVAAAALRPQKTSRLPMVLFMLVALLAGAAATAYLKPELLHRVGLGDLADRLGLQVAGSGAAGSEGPVSGGAPPAGPEVDLPAPLPAGEVVTIAVSSDPPGARLYMDNQEVMGGTVTLPEDDAGRHTVVAENDCFVDRATVQASDTDPVVISLQTPRLETIQVTSDPPGASIYVDGKSAGVRTPAEVNLARCQPHSLEGRLKGHQNASRKFGEGTDWVAQRSVSLQLSRLPDGYVSVKGPYALQVLEGGKAVGAPGAPVKLPAGKHRLAFVNRALFVEVTAEVEVPPDGTVKPRLVFPGVGKMSVYASPSSGEVFVNDRKIGFLPILDLELAEGTYTVKYVLPSGQTDSQKVLVMEGQSEQVKFQLK